MTKVLALLLSISFFGIQADTAGQVSANELQEQGAQWPPPPPPNR